MILPLLVDGLKHDHLDEVLHQITAEGFEFGVEDLTALLRQQFLEVGGVQPEQGLLRDIQLKTEEAEGFAGNTVPIPFRGRNLLHGKGLGNILHGVLHHLQKITAGIGPGQDLLALGVDHLPLLVHDIVILDEVFPDLEVVGLHLLLGVLDGPGDHPVSDGLPLLDFEHIHDPGHPVGAEDPEQVVLEREEELG